MIDRSVARLEEITELICDLEFFFDYEEIGGLSGLKCRSFGDFPQMYVNALKLPMEAEIAAEFGKDTITFYFGRPVTCEYFEKGLFSRERIECR